MTQDERKLIGAVQAGDRQAFDTLYGRYAPRVFAFTLQLSGSRADAEDLTQEAFVAAFQGLGRFRGQSSLLSWLLGIALRRRRDAQRRPSPPALDTPTHGGGLADRTADVLLLRDALAALPEPQREAFLLVASQGLTHKEAADLLGTPLGTVKWRVAEATRRLRAALQEDTEDTEQESPHAPSLHR